MGVVSMEQQLRGAMSKMRGAWGAQDEEDRIKVREGRAAM